MTDVKKLRELLNRASAGPWEASNYLVFFADNAGGFSLSACPQRDDNAALIAGAVNALPALLDELERNRWQPIETAPKDGTAVLVMRNDWPGCRNGVAEKCNGHNTYVAEWWPEERDGAGDWICYMDAVKDPECPVTPTHWMPLPAPPAAQQEQQQ